MTPEDEPDADTNAESDVPARSPQTDVAYRIEIRGVEDSTLMDILTRSSQLVALESKPPASRVRLVRRVEEDMERLGKVLRSEGFYGGKISYSLDDEGTPVGVKIDVTSGPAYKIAAYDIIYQPPAGIGIALPRGLDAVGVKAGARARARTIVDAQEKLLRELGKQGRPLARVANRRVMVDHGAQTLSVRLTVDPGPESRFGPVSFEGLDSVEERYLRRFVRWSEGDLYDQEKVEQLGKRLRETNLFETVKVDRADTISSDGRLPVTVRAREGKHRSIGAGVNYSSSEGFGGEIFWEHRNLLGEQESLRATLTGAEIRQELALDFRKPNYKRLDQDLLTRTALIRQETDAFDETGASQFVGLERRLSKFWRVSTGGSVEYSQITDNDGEEDFTLLGIPSSIRRDDTDDALDPGRGSRFQLSVTPFLAFEDRTFPFVRNELAGSYYYSVLPNKRFVAAVRAKLGSIAGAPTDDIPATKRFYAGGGGSIRGFAFQEVGPLDGAGDPLGGRSVIEVGLDLRFRVTDTIGIVPFIEAGNVYDEEVPDFSEPLLIGAGLGFRYFTAVGPIRLDIGFPINGREGVDDDFQFYVSLGQAF